MSNIYIFGFNDSGSLVRIRQRLGKFTGEIPSANQLAQVQAALGIAGGGVGASIETTLMAWTRAEAYTVTDRTNTDANGVLQSGPVVWPDGTAGIYTLIVQDTSFPVCNCFQITYVALGGKTVTQPLITRNALGQPTSIPILVIT
jgi:hypothetical protein